MKWTTADLERYKQQHPHLFQPVTLAPKPQKLAAPAPRAHTPSSLEQRALEAIAQAGLPEPVQEYKFMEKRRFRFDFAYPVQKIAIEIEGGLYGKSRHTSIDGYTKDCDKYNLAALEGWRVFRFTAVHMKQDGWLNVVRVAMEVRA
jgi:very-short-patch-repair endonuclease